jgi:hypothetical protein
MRSAWEAELRSAAEPALGSAAWLGPAGAPEPATVS